MERNQKCKIEKHLLPSDLFIDFSEDEGESKEFKKVDEQQVNSYPEKYSQSMDENNLNVNILPGEFYLQPNRKTNSFAGFFKQEIGERYKGAYSLAQIQNNYLSQNSITSINSSIKVKNEKENNETNSNIFGQVFTPNNCQGLQESNLSFSQFNKTNNINYQCKNVSLKSMDYNPFSLNNQNIPKNKINFSPLDSDEYSKVMEGIKTPLSEYLCLRCGSRAMQDNLKTFKSETKTLIIYKIMNSFVKIMCNVYGNYFCQKLYASCSLEQRFLILCSISNNFMRICKNEYGAHVIQIMIETAKSPQERSCIINNLKGHEMELALDQEGTHVLQKVMEKFQENEWSELVLALCSDNYIKILSQNKLGVCVMKRIITYTKNVNVQGIVIEKIVNNLFAISNNSFGNYIIRYIFEEWNFLIYSKLLFLCVVNSNILVTQQYSINIINKIIELFTVNNVVNGIDIIKELKNRIIINNYNNINLICRYKIGEEVMMKLFAFLNLEEVNIIYRVINELKLQGNIETSKILEKLLISKLLVK